MRGKDRVDPELARLVEERLERLLAERGPQRADRRRDGGRAQEVSSGEATRPVAPRRATEDPTEDLNVDSTGGSIEDQTVEPVGGRLGGSLGLPGLPHRWSVFTRAHLAILGAIAVLAVLLAGWAVLRAQPVSLPAAAVSDPRATPGVSAPGVDGQESPTGPTPAGSVGARASPRTLVVHVLGEVRRPGLVQLPEQSRVQDAIDRAGGLRAGADLGALNLAQILEDGQQLVIGGPRSSGSELNGGAAKPGSGPSGAASGQVNLNTATAAALEALPDVGPVTAAKIIAWRDEHGGFTRVEELQEVAGIGPKTYAEIAPHCRV